VHLGTKTNLLDFDDKQSKLKLTTWPSTVKVWRHIYITV